MKEWSKIVDVLCCPESGGSLRIVSKKELFQIHKSIEKKQLFNKEGNFIEELCENALICDESGTLYLVHDGMLALKSKAGVFQNQLTPL